tara:strand:- start:52 stop:297 length:246 start_codon:yes stop_codon:yes gene_type:complete
MNNLILLVLLPVLSITSWSNEFDNTIEVGDLLATIALEEVINLEASQICHIYGITDDYVFDDVDLSYYKTKDWNSLPYIII